ncbi:MAG: sigma-70 family RNA polymerase sigma factor [Phycisphaerales bacterium]
MTSESHTHLSLLARLSKGVDARAWADFLERYGDLIRAVCVRRGLQGADAEDVLQDVLVSLSRSMPGFSYDPSKGRFRSYLCAVVSNAISRRMRQSGPVAGLPSAAEAVPVEDDLWEEEWRQHHFRNAMRVVEQEFNPNDLSAFRMYAMEGRAVAVVGESLGMSVDAVYQAKSRVLKRLSAQIAAQVEEEG